MQLREFFDSPRPYFIAAVILFALAIFSQFEIRFPTRDERPPEEILELGERDDLNVVFIVVDTLRADRLGIYGYERATSPLIDDLSSHGIVFENVLSQSSWTKTSMASLWTGIYPANHGVTRFNHALPQDAVMPAEIFREHGYRTAGIWRNGWVAPNFGFGQGFEIYVRPKPGRESIRIQRRNPGTHKLSGTDEDLVNAATDFLDNFGRERFFLYLHYMDVHQYVYDKEAAKFGTSYSDVYDQSINWTDRLIAVVVQKLEDLDVFTKTVIAIASDHGEAFQEHGTEGHAKNLFREVVDVPFLIVLPFVLDPGIVVEEQIANVDVWPTLLDLVGLPPLPGTDGVSRVPEILAAGGVESPDAPAATATASADGNRRIFKQLDRRWGNPSQDPDPIVGVAEGDLRFFMRKSRGEDGLLLFDHASDPLEQQNLSEERPEDVARLEALATDYLESASNPWGSEPEEVVLDKMKLEQLRALGYVIK